MTPGFDLRGALAELGWSITDLSKRVERTRTQVSRWVSGHVETPMAVERYVRLVLEVRRLADRLGGDVRTVADGA